MKLMSKNMCWQGFKHFLNGIFKPHYSLHSSSSQIRIRTREVKDIYRIYMHRHRDYIIVSFFLFSFSLFKVSLFWSLCRFILCLQRMICKSILFQTYTVNYLMDPDVVYLMHRNYTLSLFMCMCVCDGWKLSLLQ